jgi:hypothetical protein
MNRNPIVFEGVTLDEARQKLFSDSPRGLFLQSETAIPPRSKRTTGVGDSTEQAFAATLAQQPEGMTVSSKKEISSAGRTTVAIDAWDKEAAAALVLKQAGPNASLEALTERRPPKGGFLGIGKAPGKYEAVVFHKAVVEVQFGQAARIEATFGARITTWAGLVHHLFSPGVKIIDELGERLSYQFLFNSSRAGDCLDLLRHRSVRSRTGAYDREIAGARERNPIPWNARKNGCGRGRLTTVRPLRRARRRQYSEENQFRIRHVNRQRCELSAKGREPSCHVKRATGDVRVPGNNALREDSSCALFLGSVILARHLEQRSTISEDGSSPYYWAPIALYCNWNPGMVIDDDGPLRTRAAEAQVASVPIQVLMRKGASLLGRARIEGEKQSYNLLPKGEKEALGQAIDFLAYQTLQRISNDCATSQHFLSSSRRNGLRLLHPPFGKSPISSCGLFSESLEGC